MRGVTLERTGNHWMGEDFILPVIILMNGWQQYSAAEKTAICYVGASAAHELPCSILFLVFNFECRSSKCALKLSLSLNPIWLTEILNLKLFQKIIEWYFPLYQFLSGIIS